MRWIAVTMIAILALSYALIVFAAPSTEVRPSPDDQGFGGLSLFANALRDGGYRVVVDPSSKPRPLKQDVLVAPVRLTRGQTLETPDAVLRFVKAGGRALVVSVPDMLQPVGESVEVVDARGGKAKVDWTIDSNLPEPPSQIASAAIWMGDGSTPATLTQVGAGRIVRLEEGALATNRFLGREDNARVVLSSLAKVARPGDRLVFVAMGYGEAKDLGPIEAIGPWAVATLWQTLGVLALYGIARGVRFGLPTPDVRQRRGARELLDALAGHYRRGRKTDAPLLAAARERPDDMAVQAIAVRPKVSESEARQALVELESRPANRRPLP